MKPGYVSKIWCLKQQIRVNWYGQLFQLWQISPKNTSRKYYHIKIKSLHQNKKAFSPFYHKKYFWSRIWQNMVLGIIKRGKVFKNGPIKICGRQPLKSLKWHALADHITSKAVFHKFYLVYSWILCIKFESQSKPRDRRQISLLKLSEFKWINLLLTPLTLSKNHRFFDDFRGVDVNCFG